MLTKNKLGAAILKNCYIFSLEDHNKEAQKPTNLNLNDLI
jgi:ribosomal protein L13